MTASVLVIDDQPSILQSMEVFFQLRSWKVHTAPDGKRGIALARKVRPDLVVLDIRNRIDGGSREVFEAGHIPGALNRPFADNFGPDGRFKPAAALRAEFERLLAGRDPATVIHHCGSGVSAVPNLLAMEVAGLGRGRLYPGSWSEWCNTPGLPCAQGPWPDAPAVSRPPA